MAGIGPISQDWEPVVIRKKAPTAAARKDEKAVNAARRAGAEIETIKKCLFLSLTFSAIRVSDSRQSIYIWSLFYLYVHKICASIEAYLLIYVTDSF